MLQISTEQFEQLERARLMTIKQEIIARLRRDHPVQCRALGDVALASFVRDSMNAARACAVTTPEQIRRFAALAFQVVHVDSDPNGAERFAGIMLAEHSADARLRFAAESLEAHKEIPPQP